MLITLLVVCTLFVAYANGANDNFKGVATLYGSGTTRFRGALWLGTLATLAGSIASVYLAAGLVRAFSGRGLVPDELTTATPFLTAVAFGAAGTVMLATWRGLPISTTHALTGALVGAGLAGAGSSLNLNALGTTFVLPLLLSPLLSVALTMLAYRCAQTIANRLQVSRNTATASVTPRHRYQGGYFGAATQSVVDSLALCERVFGQLRAWTQRHA
jgi:PiT family inorganic phosphate transporter